MEVTAFTHDARLTRAFFDLEHEVYRHDRAFIPPLRRARRAALGPHGRLPGGDGPQHLRFLAGTSGRPLARVLLALPADLRDVDGTPVGALGFFEALERGAARDVLQAACGALAARGRRRAWAPLDVDVWHGYRVMTRGFERERFFGEPYNPPVYPEWLAAAGLQVRRRWHTFELLGDEPLCELQALHQDACAEAAAAGYRCESLEGLGFESVVRRLHTLLAQSFAGFLGVTPLALDAFREVFERGRAALEPCASVFVRGPGGEDAGFALVFHDLGAAVRALRGSDSWLARARFLCERGRTRRVMLHLGGLTGERAARPRGLARAALWDVLGRLRALRRESVLVTLMAEGSPARRLFGRFAEQAQREYALFEWRA